MMGLTPQLRDCFNFIVAYQAKNGIPPTFGEIMASQHLNSRSGVSRLLTGLEDRGYIRRLRKKSRAIEILPRKLVCPHCGHIAGSTLCRAAAGKKITYSSTPTQQVAA